jgi:PAS domain-containing protein
LQLIENDPRQQRGLSERESGGVDQARIGQFAYDVATDTWEWSPGVYLIYGFDRGEVIPSTALMRAHVHPEDRETVFEGGLERAVRDAEPFSAYYRLVDAGQRTRRVLTVGNAVVDDTGTAVRIDGHIVDLTDANAASERLAVTEAVADFKAHRAIIEQAKGVIMQLCSVDADEAFLVLVGYSKHANVRVRVVAEQLVQAASSERTPARQSRARVLETLTSLLG